MQVSNFVELRSNSNCIPACTVQASVKSFIIKYYHGYSKIKRLTMNIIYIY